MVFPSGHDRSAPPGPTGGDGDGRPIWFFQTVTSIIIIIIIIIVVIIIIMISPRGWSATMWSWQLLSLVLAVAGPELTETGVRLA